MANDFESLLASFYFIEADDKLILYQQNFLRKKVKNSLKLYTLIPVT